MRTITSCTLALLTGLLGGAGLAAGSAAAEPAASTLVGIRAGGHTGYDRLVFDFDGALPTSFGVDHLGDGGTAPPGVVGDAFLHVELVGASVGGEGIGAPTRTYALPNLIQVAEVTAVEDVLAFDIGLASDQPVTAFTLTDPPRVVLDIATPDRVVPVDVTLIQDGTLEPVAVTRQVIPPATARGALQRMFAGPTEAEIADGLHFVASGATGFADLSIVDGVARVRLTGGCDSGGATTTIASEIMPTLKQFPSVQWVKIFDPAGETEVPAGQVDSIPFCLEP